MLQNLGSGLASTSEGRHYRYFPKEQTVKLCIYTSFFFFSSHFYSHSEGCCVWKGKSHPPLPKVHPTINTK